MTELPQTQNTRTVTIKVPRGDRSARLPSLRARVTAGPDRGLELTLSKPLLQIGRAPTADVRLTDPTVSQFHTEIAVSADGIDVADLGSLNGTHAGAARVREARLPFGAEITVGHTRLALARDGEFVAERSSASSFGELVGWSRSMREVYAVLERLSNTDLSILIEGETGTGKELAARSVHAASRRASGPFVTVDCTAIPPTLAESTLFGHEKGSFTGAIERRMGLLEAANGGTIFLDEIGDLPLEVQPKLLRVLERREVTLVGTTRPRPIDVRVLSATWRNLRAMVNAGTFRDDLYFRIAQARVRLPGLTERPEDVRPLIQHFLASLPAGVRAARGIASEALDSVAARRFSGNVRELKNVVERLAMLAEGPVITMADVLHDRALATGAKVPALAAASTDEAARGGDAVEPFKEAKRTLVDRFERAYLARILARAGTNVSRAAALAGIERQTLRDLLKKHGMRGEE